MTFLRVCAWVHALSVQQRVGKSAPCAPRSASCSVSCVRGRSAQVCRRDARALRVGTLDDAHLSLIHISEPTRRTPI
eukprot:3580087-Pleurochrysis_carterae.AAC.1